MPSLELRLNLTPAARMATVPRLKSRRIVGLAVGFERPYVARDASPRWVAPSGARAQFLSSARLAADKATAARGILNFERTGRDSSSAR